jgi:hypothetical protein
MLMATVSGVEICFNYGIGLVKIMIKIKTAHQIKTRSLLKGTNFWDITPCSPLSVNRSFGETYRIHLQGRKNKFSKKPAWKQAASHSTDYTALYPRRLYSSQPPLWEPQILHSSLLLLFMSRWYFYVLCPCWFLVVTNICYLLGGWIRHWYNLSVTVTNLTQGQMDGRPHPPHYALILCTLLKQGITNVAYIL